MTVSKLKSILSELPDDMSVHVIVDGCIDSQPDWNVVDDILYIEGVSPEKGGAK